MRPWGKVYAVARLSGVPARTIYVWIAEGRLTTVGHGRGRLVDQEEVEYLRDLRRHTGRLPRLDRAG